MIPLLSILFLGFFLGMRHATDADHVIAVTTIVSRERSIRHPARIGGTWGIGHTLTMLAVGGAHIMFGTVTTPPLRAPREFPARLTACTSELRNVGGFR